MKQAALLALLAALMPAPAIAQFDEEDDEPIVDVAIFSTDASLGYVRVAISHDIQPKEAPEYITIRWVGDSARIPLQPSEGGLRFESGVLQLVSAELRGDSRFVDGRAVRPRLDAVYPGSARAAAELFSGPWLVAHTERNGNMAMGVGMVSADGESARLILDTSAGPKRFVSDDLLAVPDSIGGKHGLEIRFRPEGESGPEGPALALARTIYVPDNTTEVDIETSKESYVVQVSPWRGPAPEDIKVNLMVDTSREMHGGWSFEEANGRLVGGGQQTWNKGLEIERIVVLENQRPQPHKGRSYESFANNENAIYEDYSPGEPIPGRDRLTDYPFAEGSQNDKVTRTIMIVGKGLPVRTSDARVIRSLMDGFSYELVALPGENDDLFRRGWNKVEAEREAELASGRATLRITMKQDDDGPATDAIIFRATFTDLVGAGVKTLSLNNAIGGWHLDFADSNAHLRFAKFREGIAEDDDEQDGESSADTDDPLLVDTAEFPWRHGTTGRNGHYETIHTPYVGDDIYVVIEDQIPMRRDSVDIDIFLNKKHVGRIAADYKHAEDRTQFVSTPIKLRPPLVTPLRVDANATATPHDTVLLDTFGLGESRNEPLELIVRANDRLDATLADPSLVHTFPPVVHADIAQDPGDLGMVWKDALRRAAACYGDNATDIDFDALTREQAKEYSELIAWDNKMNFLRLTNPLWVFQRTVVEQEELFDYRKIGVSKGDHAAALLIRDEFLKAMGPEIKRFRDVVQDDEKLWKFYWTHRSNDVPFWKVAKVTGPVEMESEYVAGALGFIESINDDLAPLTLADEAIMLAEYLYKEFGFDTDENADRGDWVIGDLVSAVTVDPMRYYLVSPRHGHMLGFRKTKEALVEYLNSADYSYVHAQTTSDCHLDDLLLIAAQDLDKVVARILPRLVQRAEDSQTWEPDVVARGYVGSLKLKGAAIRAQKHYAALDKGFQAGVLIIASAGAASVLAAGGAVLAAEMVMLGADIADLVLFGPEAIAGYVDSYGGHRLKVAEGISLVGTEKAYYDALAANTEWWGAALGAFAPGAGIGVGVRSVRNVRAVAHGADIMKGLGKAGQLDGAAVRAMPLANRMALFARLGDLQSRLGDGANLLFRRDGAWWNNFGRVLDKAEIEEFNKFARFLRSEGVEIADAKLFFKRPGLLDDAVDSVTAARNAEAGAQNASAAQADALVGAAVEAEARAARANAAVEAERAARAAAAADTRAVRDSADAARAESAARLAREAEADAAAKLRAAREAEANLADTAGLDPATAGRAAREAEESAARELQEAARADDAARAAKEAEADALKTADEAREAERAAGEALEAEARATAEGAEAEARAAREAAEAESRAAEQAAEAARAEEAARLAREAETDAALKARQAEEAEAAAAEAAEAEALAARKAAREAAEAESTAARQAAREADERAAAQAQAKAEARAAAEAAETRRAEAAERAARQAEQEQAARVANEDVARAAREASEAETRRIADATNTEARAAEQAAEARRAEEAARAASEAETQSIARAAREAEADAARRAELESQARAARETSARRAREAAEAEAEATRLARSEADTNMLARAQEAAASRRALDDARRAATETSANAAAVRRSLDEAAAEARASYLRAVAESEAAEAAAEIAQVAKVEHLRGLPAGRVSVNGGELDLDFGSLIGEGKTTSAFRVAGDDGAETIRVMRRGFEPEDVAYDRLGYELLVDTEGGAGGLFRVPRQSDPVLIRSVSDPRYQDLVGSYVSVARRVDGRAAEQVVEQGGKMTKGQLLALKQTVSYLNRNGIVWGDNHLGNFKFTRLDPDKDIWSLDIFDTGGFYKMLGDTPADEFRNARTLQRAFNPGDNDFMSNYRAARQAGDVVRVKDMERARALSIGKASRNIDWDAFDTPVENLIGTAISSSPTMRPNYRLLDNLNPADADKLYARHTGKTPAVGLPIDPGDVRGQGPLPDSILDAVDRRWTEDALRVDPQGSGGSGSGSGTIRDDPTGTGGTGTGGTGTGGGGGSGGTGGTGGSGGGGAAADAGDEGTWVLPYRENFRSLDEPPAPRIETERIRTVREDMRDIEALGRTSPTETLDMGDLDALVRRLEAEEAGFDAFRNAETERFTRAEERALAEVAESERLQRMSTYLDEQDTFKSYDDLEEYIRANRLSEISFRVGDDGATESRQLGEFVGGGAFNEVIRDGQNADQVLRVSKYVEGHDMHRLEAQGRRGGEAAALARPDDLIVPTRRGYFPDVSSRDPRLNGKTIEYVDNVPEQTAKELFALNGGQPNPWQADAYARGVRALNDQGHILADAHPGNYTFRSRPGTDRLTMVIIDPGAVVRAEGGLPANARLAQDMIDNPAQDLVERWAVAGADNKYRWAAKKTVLMKEGLEDLIDLDTLGVRHGDFVPMAPQGAEIFPDAAELLRLSPEDAARRLEEMMRDFRNAETERIPIAATPRDGTAIVPLKPVEPHFRLLDLAA